MPLELDSAAVIAGLLTLGILTCSALLWMSYLNGSERQVRRLSLVPTWSIGWPNFGLFLCTLAISISLTQLVAVKLVQHSSEPAISAQETVEVDSSNETTEVLDTGGTERIETTASTSWIAVLSLLSMQIPMLATFYGLRRFYPESFGGSINQKTISLRKALSETTSYFIRCFPLIWLAALIWLGLLTGLQKIELIDEAPPQQLVTIVSNSEAPAAVALIFICAVVVAPLAEELIFRGAIYRFLKGHTSLFAAQLISGALFAVMHSNLMSFVPLLVLGVLLARIYEREGNILLPILFHSSWNGLSMLMLFLSTQSDVPFGPN